MSLSETLLALTTPGPSFHDTEDDDDTAAKVTHAEQEEQDDDVEVDSSSIRRKAAPLLEEEDKRYSGKAVSRKKYAEEFGFDEDDDSLQEVESEEEKNDKYGSDDDMQKSNSDKNLAATKMKLDEDEADESGSDFENEDDETGSEDESEAGETGSDFENEAGETESEDENEAGETGSDFENEAGDTEIEGESEADELQAFKKKLQAKTGKTSGTDIEGFTFEDDGDYGKYGDKSDDDLASAGSAESDVMDESDGSDFSGDTGDESGGGDSEAEIASGDNEGKSDGSYQSDGNDQSVQNGGSGQSNGCDVMDESDLSDQSGDTGDGSGDGDSEEEIASADNEAAQLVGLDRKEVSEEVEKGKAACAQLGLWDSLLEGRIRMQKALSLVNRLPQPDAMPSFLKSGGQPWKNASSECTDAVKTLLEKLVQLQTLLLLQNPQTKHVVLGGKSAKNTSKGGDEEITSEEDKEEEEGDRSDKMAASGNSAMKRAVKDAGKKRKIEVYDDILAKRFKSFTEFRNTTIQKWHDKTLISSGKLGNKSRGFAAFEQNTVRQIQQVMNDRKRLIDRTRTKRTDYVILGKSATQNETPQNGDKTGSDEETTELQETKTQKSQNAYDEEIFDDSDFYHQLLRELIEHKTAAVQDPIELSRQFIQMQGLRKKVKKNVDTRASKGRKIRYEIHLKLVNFMAPEDTCEWANEARDDLFESLFGKVKKRITVKT